MKSTKTTMIVTVALCLLFALMSVGAAYAMSEETLMINHKVKSTGDDQCTLQSTGMYQNFYGLCLVHILERDHFYYSMNLLGKKENKELFGDKSNLHNAGVKFFYRNSSKNGPGPSDQPDWKVVLKDGLEMQSDSKSISLRSSYAWMNSFCNKTETGWQMFK